MTFVGVLNYNTFSVVPSIINDSPKNAVPLTETANIRDKIVLRDFYNIYKKLEM